MSKELKFILALLAGSAAIMLIGPFTIYEHYVFGLMALTLVAILFAPFWIKLGCAALLALLWLPPLVKGDYFHPTRVLTGDRIRCIQAICSKYPQPIYVVTNSGSHDHQGLGYAYLAQQNGCDMFAVTQWTNQTPKTMAVMNEKASFDLAKTDFYELNRFGPRSYIGEEQCSNTLTVSVFSSK